MPGEDSSYMWQGFIPDSENVLMHNPERGFVSSANQYPYDPKTYPYYLGGEYPPFRAFLINRYLTSMQHITANDMQRLQTNNYNLFAEFARPALLKYVQTDKLDDADKRYLQLFEQWNLEK